MTTTPITPDSRLPLGITLSRDSNGIPTFRVDIAKLAPNSDAISAFGVKIATVILVDTSGREAFANLAIENAWAGRATLRMTTAYRNGDKVTRSQMTPWIWPGASIEIDDVISAMTFPQRVRLIALSAPNSDAAQRVASATDRVLIRLGLLSSPSPSPGEDRRTPLGKRVAQILDPSKARGEDAAARALG